MSEAHLDCIFYGICGDCPIKQGKDSIYTPGENCPSCQYYSEEEKMCMILEAIRSLDETRKNTYSPSNKSEESNVNL